MSSYSDVEQPNKLSKKLARLVDNNDISLEVEYGLDFDLDKQILPDLSKTIINAFSNYKLEPDAPSLIRCSFRHKKDDFYSQKFYLLNSEGYMAPDEITTSDIQILIDLISQEILHFKSEKSKDLKNYIISLSFYTVYQSS